MRPSSSLQFDVADARGLSVPMASGEELSNVEIDEVVEPIITPSTYVRIVVPDLSTQTSYGVAVENAHVDVKIRFALVPAEDAPKSSVFGVVSPRTRNNHARLLPAGVYAS